MPVTLAWYDRILPYAPFATAFVTFCALATAIVAIHKQTQVARRRAAIDFFLKTDRDQNMLDAFRDFESALTQLKGHMAAGGVVKDFAEAQPDIHRQLLKYLNVHELVAVGIRNRVFDHQVCYSFWGDTLVRHVEEAEALIAYEVETGPPSHYLELRLLTAEWGPRARKWRIKHARNHKASL
jgi:hypothetical protein